MGFFDIFKKKVEVRNYDISHLNHLFSNNISANTTALSLSTIYRCIDLISGQISLLPIRVNDDDVQERISYLFASTYLGGEVNLLKQLMLDLLRYGNAYLHLTRDNNNAVTKLRYYQPNKVSIIYNETEQEVYYQLNNVGRKVERINMVHLKLWSNDSIHGVSPLAYATNSTKLALSVEDSARNHYEGGMNLSGVLETTQQLTASQREQIHTSWGNHYVQNRLAILGGGLSYKPIQSSLSESQNAENRKLSTFDLARFFGVHPALLGESSGSIYDIESLSLTLMQYTLQPIISMIESELSLKLLTPADKRRGIKINLDENTLLRTNKQNLASYYTSLLQSGVYSPNEVRAELGLEAKEGLDKHIIAYTDIEQNTINQEDSNNNGE